MEGEGFSVNQFKMLAGNASPTRTDTEPEMEAQRAQRSLRKVRDGLCQKDAWPGEQGWFLS